MADTDQTAPTTREEAAEQTIAPDPNTVVDDQVREGLTNAVENPYVNEKSTVDPEMPRTERDDR